MNIAIDVRPLSRNRSGVGYYIRNLLRGFSSVAREERFHLFHHAPEALGPGDLPESAAVVRSPFSHESHPLGDLWRDYWLPRSLRRLGIDVFHGPAFMIPRAAHGLATVVTIHDLVAFLHPKTVPWRYSLYMRAQIRAALSRADRIIAISRAEAQELVETAGAPPERIRVVYHGVEPRFRPPAGPEEAAPVLARYGIERPFLFHLGNIEPRKNLVSVFRAYERVLDRADGGVSLVVAGAEGWLCRETLEEARRLTGRRAPIFTGYVPEGDVPALLGAASVFVFPSLYEGFGLPILEAMACGVPVVTSDRGAMREIAGGAASLVEPEDPDAIAQAILGILEDRAAAARLAAAGRAHAAGFTWERTAAETLGVYREAVATA
jgi:glycosyltransferase involved in cell wall biosynthesis